MKSQIALAAAIVMFSAAAWSQITVSGSAEIKVAPDEIYLCVGVETRDASLSSAKSENDKNVSKAIKFLKQRGIKEKDIQTDFLKVQPHYESNNSTLVDYYTVQKILPPG